RSAPSSGCAAPSGSAGSSWSSPSPATDRRAPRPIDVLRACGVPSGMARSRRSAKYLDIHPEDPQPRLIQQAVAVLEDGGLIAYPTDSCYALDRKSTRLNSSHVSISYAVF